MIPRILLLLFLTNVFHHTCSCFPTPFSIDSAQTHLTYFAQTLGLRQAGSPNEAKALQYSLEKFRAFGLQTHFMEIKPLYFRNAVVNGTTGVAYGIKHGKRGKIIVLGAHIDSASPEVPGAIDNASGAACILELARILSQEQLNSTLVFCIFGAEEIGSLGSQYFVEHFPFIDSVVLMVQLDMANGTNELMPFIDSKSHNTPSWLVRAADSSLRSLGYDGLWYPTHFFTFNRIFLGRGIGSDHQPFLEYGIPALCLSSSINDPIHTAQDNLDNVRISGLKRSADLLYTLVHHFNEHVPRNDLTPYHFIIVGSFPISIPQWLAIIFIAVSVFFPPILLIIQRKNLLPGVGEKKPFPALKVFVLLLCIFGASWYSENLIGFLKGVRYPWIVEYEPFLLVAFFTGLFASGIVLRFFPNIFFWASPVQWFTRAVVLFSITTILLFLVDFRLALYPATALALLSIVLIVKNRILQYSAWGLSTWVLFRLIFSEGFHFLARSTVLHQYFPPVISAAIQGTLLLFFTYWFFPAILTFMGITSQLNVSRLLTSLSSWKSLTLQMLLALFASLYALSKPSYNEDWRPNVTAEYRVMNDSTIFRLTSPEYITGTHVTTRELDTLIRERTNDVLFSLPHDTLCWFTEHFSLETPEHDTSVTSTVHIQFHFLHKPMEFTVRCSPTTAIVYDAISPWHTNTSRTAPSLTFLYPDSTLYLPLSLVISKNDTLHFSYEAVFHQLPPGITIDKPLTNIITRTVIHRDMVVTLK